MCDKPCYCILNKECKFYIVVMRSRHLSISFVKVINYHKSTSLDVCVCIDFHACLSSAPKVFNREQVRCLLSKSVGRNWSIREYNRMRVGGAGVVA